MFATPYQLPDVGGLPQVFLPRAVLAMSVMHNEAPVAVVLDADRGQFVRAAGIPAGYWCLLGLSADGRQLLLLARRGTPPFPGMIWLDGLCLFDLATGQQRWFPAKADGQDWVGALSPDGTTIATLSTPEDPENRDDIHGGLAAVGLTDVATGRRRRLWATPGGHSRESGVSWSPNGQLVAVTYLIWHEERGDDYLESVVLDLAGKVLWQRLDAAIPPASNGAWLNDHELLVILEDEQPGVLTIDLAAGTQRVVGECYSGVLAVAGNRIVRGSSEALGEDGFLLTSDLDLTNTRPFVTAPRNFGPIAIDLIPGALGQQ